jgi:tryptophan 2,3-dioxygenase
MATGIRLQGMIMMVRDQKLCGGEGNQSVQLGYSEYLELPQLLGLQRPLGVPFVPDEMLFIIVHQAHELWFKQILLELRLLIAHLENARWSAAAAKIDRINRVVRLLTGHLEILSTMPPEEFQKFRAALGSASGMQSEQYREIERLVGEPMPRAHGASSPAGEQSVRSAFTSAVCSAQSVAAQGIAAQSVATLSAAKGAASNPDLNPLRQVVSNLFRCPERAPERAVAERLIEFDAQIALWRTAHVDLARLMIGGACGTGGSSGVNYLKQAVERRFFPELDGLLRPLSLLPNG